ncbi:hypothetical protein D3C71_561630 [compost metagenome]
MKNFKVAALIVVSSLSMMVKDAGAQTATIDRIWIERLEESLDLDAVLDARARMGGGAPQPMTEYARYYRAVETNGRTIVEAVFAPPVEPYPSDWRTSRYTKDGMEDLGPVQQPSEEALRRGRRGVHIDEPFPMIFDGGCSVVTLSFDYQSGRVLTAHCNGVA